MPPSPRSPGLAVRAVEGDRANMKITTPADFSAAERMLASASETRTGQGFDVHAFGPGDAVWLCGVKIPARPCALSAIPTPMSALHALTDALLGTIGDGDIGKHFPPSDPKWKGASSDRFLADAVRRVQRARRAHRQPRRDARLRSAEDRAASRRRCRRASPRSPASRPTASA